MKKSILFLVFATGFIFSCTKDEVVPLVADFEVSVTGEAPNATVNITNNSTGAASTYKWSFGEGSDRTSSTLLTPSTLTVDKAGDFIVKLVISTTDGEKEVSKTVAIPGNSAVLSFTSLEFGYNNSITSYGRFFSVETGLIYKDSEVTSDNGSKINLAFNTCGTSCYYFESPSAGGYGIPNVTVSKVVNYEATPSISATAFDSMVDDYLLLPLTIVNADDSFGVSTIPGTILFEMSDGRKGVIKTEAINSERILVNIKVQKYL